MLLLLHNKLVVLDCEEVNLLCQGVEGGQVVRVPGPAVGGPELLQTVGEVPELFGDLVPSLLERKENIPFTCRSIREQKSILYRASHEKICSSITAVKSIA